MAWIEDMQAKKAAGEALSLPEPLPIFQDRIALTLAKHGLPMEKPTTSAPEKSAPDPFPLLSPDIPRPVMKAALAMLGGALDDDVWEEYGMPARNEARTLIVDADVEGRRHELRTALEAALKKQG